MRWPTRSAVIASFAAWTSIGMFNVAPAVVSRLSSGGPFPKLHVALVFGSVWLWAVYTLGVWSATRRLPLAAWWRAVPVHLACAAAIALVDPLLDTPLVDAMERVPESYTTRLMDELFINVFSYLAVAGVGYALDYRRRLVEQRAREAELQAQLLRARLDAVTARLRPHFIFNALHSVTALIRTGERPAAIRAVVVLGDLLRDALRGDGSAVVPLANELAWIRQYLELEQMRFQDRLCTSIDVAADLDDAIVPALVLQPLIENAIRHGVEARIGTSRVTVSARRDADRLRLEVADEGDVAGAAPGVNGTGIGLRATRERLAHLFGDRAALDVVFDPAATRATITLPYRTEVMP